MAAGDVQVTDFYDMNKDRIASAIQTFTTYATTDIIVPIYQGNTVAFAKIKTA